MSVLIKGMEMPKCCEECVAGAYEYNENDERCFVCGLIKSEDPWECEHREIDGIDTTKARADFCPLIEVPTPHGRLIDADEFEREFNNHLLPILVKKYGEEEALKGLHFSFRDCICNIQCQKTVIEGSEE